MPRAHKWLWPLVLLVVTSRCAPNIHQSYHTLRPYLTAHDDNRALHYLQGVEQSVYGPNSALLYLMDRAMVQFDGADTAGCVATLEEAKALGAKLGGAHPGREALAWLSNDNALPYVGEEFEQVFVHVLEALSYARAGNLSDARVETRQATTKLMHLAQHLEGKPIAYQDDAFAHFLAGMLFEADSGDLGHNSDARIEYARALQLYEQVDGPLYGVAVPKRLIASLSGVLGHLGQDGAGELMLLRQRYGRQATAAATAVAKEGPHSGGEAKLVVLTLVGEAPYKGEAAWELLLGPNIYRVAYPRFVPHPKRPPPGVFLGGGTQALRPELVMDVQAIAQRNLADHMDRIKNRVLAREVAKYTAGTVAESVGLEKGGIVGLGTFLAGFALNTATAASARADTRSWATLPEAIYLYETSVPAGPVHLQVGTRPVQQFILSPGQTQFVAVRALAD